VLRQSRAGSVSSEAKVPSASPATGGRRLALAASGSPRIARGPAAAGVVRKRDSHDASGAQPARVGACRELELNRWRRDPSSPCFMLWPRASLATDQRTVDGTPGGTRLFALGSIPDGGLFEAAQQAEARARKGQRRSAGDGDPAPHGSAVEAGRKGPSAGARGWDLGHGRGRQRTSRQAHQAGSGALSTRCQAPGGPPHDWHSESERLSGANARLAGATVPCRVDDFQLSLEHGGKAALPGGTKRQLGQVAHQPSTKPEAPCSSASCSAPRRGRCREEIGGPQNAFGRLGQAGGKATGEAPAACLQHGQARDLQMEPSPCSAGSTPAGPAPARQRAGAASASQITA